VLGFNWHFVCRPRKCRLFHGSCSYRESFSKSQRKEVYIRQQYEGIDELLNQDSRLQLVPKMITSRLQVAGDVWRKMRLEKLKWSAVYSPALFLAPLTQASIMAFLSSVIDFFLFHHCWMHYVTGHERNHKAIDTYFQIRQGQNKVLDPSSIILPPMAMTPPTHGKPPCSDHSLWTGGLACPSRTRKV